MMDGPILVAGGGGRLGRTLARLGGARVSARDRSGLDISDRRAIDRSLDEVRPAAVINAAAMSAVDQCETDTDAAHAANAAGPGYLAAACAALDVPFIHVSTDYVFGADDLTRPRREADAPAPMNAYGRSKLAGERAVTAAGGRALVVRTAWLFGFPGCFLHRMLDKARTTDRLQITSQIGTPTPVGDLATVLLACAARLVDGAPTPPILNVAGAPVATRFEWVAEAVVAARLPVALDKVDLDAFASAAQRPTGTPLDTTLLRDLLDVQIEWRQAARDLGRSFAPPA